MSENDEDMKSHLLILIGCDSDELRLSEYECSELAPWQLENIVGFDDMKARLVLVHRVENRLLGKKQNGSKS